MAQSQSSLANYLNAALGVCLVIACLTLLQIVGLIIQLITLQSRIAEGLASAVDVVRIVIIMLFVLGLALAFFMPLIIRRKSFLPTYYLVVGIVLSLLFGISSIGIVLQPIMQNMASRGGGSALLLTIMLALTCTGIWLILIGSNAEIRKFQKTRFVDGLNKN